MYAIAQTGNIAYIYGDVSSSGNIPSGSASPFHQMLITNNGNRGLSQFRSLVEGEGHTIEQFYDEATNLNANFLNQFDVVIFGLHQKIWSTAERNALDTWIRAGGGTLLYSDSAAGGSFGSVGAQNNVGQRAVNNITTRYGLQVTVDQAAGTTAYRASSGASHPIVSDRPALEGEGVSPVAVDVSSGAQILIPYNNSNANRVSGTASLNHRQNITISNPTYAALALNTIGDGNLMVMFDRQPIWNNGEGSDINERDNREILRRIVNFLAEDQDQDQDNDNDNDENLALNGVARQSSTAFGGNASHAIDGNTNGAYRAGSVTHTGDDTTPFWEVDLGREFSIGDINIFGRTDNCCADRLSDYTVSVINSNGSITYSENLNEFPTALINAGNVLGQIVRIELNNGEALSLAEVQVMRGESIGDEEGNIALRGVASQSSTTFGGEASRAIDGNINGVFDRNSITHTGNDDNAWWALDLDQEYTIGEIVIYNRTDCCSDRLSNFTITVRDEAGNITMQESITTAPNPSVTIDVNGANASSIQIQSNISNEVLSLAEVEVYTSSSLKSLGLDNSALVVYPNPTSNQFTIQTSEAIATYSVIDFSGKTLLKGKIDKDSTSVDISQLPSGIYFVRMSGEKRSFMKKIIKE